jgi:Mn-dependent DtxR family transcriptional regulator
VSNKLVELKKAGLVSKSLHTWELTEKGKKHAQKIKNRPEQTRSAA